MRPTPACPHCGTPSDSGAVPDDGRGPVALGRIYIRWECAVCGDRPWLAESRFLPTG